MIRAVPMRLNFPGVTDLSMTPSCSISLARLSPRTLRNSRRALTASFCVGCSLGESLRSWRPGNAGFAGESLASILLLVEGAGCAALWGQVVWKGRGRGREGLRLLGLQEECSSIVSKSEGRPGVVKRRVERSRGLHFRRAGERVRDIVVAGEERVCKKQWGCAERLDGGEGRGWADPTYGV